MDNEKTQLAMGKNSKEEQNARDMEMAMDSASNTAIY